MKERLGWFAARGRLRLQRSFGSSDNLVSFNILPKEFTMFLKVSM